MIAALVTIVDVMYYLRLHATAVVVAAGVVVVAAAAVVVVVVVVVVIVVVVEEVVRAFSRCLPEEPVGGYMGVQKT